MSLYITCRYSCPLCGLKDIHVEVPARSEEDVRAWMETCVTTLSADHRRRAPTCHPQVLVDIMIPMVGTTKIGGPTVQ